MWLLKADGDLELKYFDEKELEPSGFAYSNQDYAVLSHRWRDAEEVDFDEVLDGRASQAKSGFKKITKCLQQARTDSIEWVWIDTCCIDKRSSAELQEAINSMYRWYERAIVCYVHLQDVHIKTFEKSFVSSEWFRRGWTLQELLAPTTVKFYDAEWVYLGDKQSLSWAISHATGISSQILEGQTSTRECSIAQRMSWAANRLTTRVEDKAYSLLGIFDVHMPMLYGEGEKAFLRLQQAILSQSDDQSIFAWNGIQSRNPGLLALSPEAFKDCDDIRAVRLRKAQPPYSITNRGVFITLSITSWNVDTYLAVLNCARNGAGQSSRIGVFIRRLYEDDQYARVSINGEEMLDDALIQTNRAAASTTSVPFHVRQIPLLPGEEHYLLDRIYGFRLNESLIAKDSKGKDLFDVRVPVDGCWDPETRMATLPPGSKHQGSVCLIWITKQRRKIGKIRLGFDSDFNPAIFLSESVAIEQKEPGYSKTESLGYGLKYSDYTNTANRQRALTLETKDFNDNGGWNAVSRTKDGRNVGPIQMLSGLWAFKGDRINGLDVYLSDNDDSKMTDGTHVQFNRINIGGWLVWDVIIDNLPPAFSSKLRNVFRSEKHVKNG